MNSNILKFFTCVADYNSITIASEHLGVTQANVTMRIKQLEKELGFELFHRVPKGVILTQEGEKLLPLAKNLEKKLVEIKSKMKNIHSQESLIIACAYSNARIRLVSFMEKIHKDYPDIKLKIIRDNNYSIIDELLNFKIDVGFIDYKPNNDEVIILKEFKNELLFLEEKNAKEENNTILSCGDHCQFYDGIKEYYKHLGIVDYETVQIPDFEIILSSITCGMGKSVLPKIVVEKLGYMDKLKTTRITNKVLKITTYLICRKGNMPKISDYLKELDIS